MSIVVFLIIRLVPGDPLRTVLDYRATAAKVIEVRHQLGLDQSLLADDAKGLVDHLGFSAFHLMGVSMGGLIAEEYALACPDDIASLTLACTFSKADAFCQQMFARWGDLARSLGVPFAMRDVALWAFTGPFFEERPEDAAEFGAAMASLEMPLHAYLSQLNVIQQRDALDRVSQITTPPLVLAGEQDILIPGRLSMRLRDAIPGAEWMAVPFLATVPRSLPPQFRRNPTTEGERYAVPASHRKAQLAA